MTKQLRFNALAPVAVILITIIGFWLRYRCLDCLGFHSDEDLTSLAVKALSEKGVPELPSGMIYLRFYPYQWLLSLSVAVFGFSEFSMRLPAVIFGTALIPTAYLVLKRLTDRKTAVIVALGIAVCFSQVELSRMARMYAPFFLVYLLAAYAVYRSVFEDRTKLFAPLALTLCLLALAIHQLAYSLAVFFLLAIALNPTLRRTGALFLQAGFVGVAFLVIKSIQEGYFYRARELADTPPPAPDGGGGIVSALLEQVSLPDFGLLSAFLQASWIAGGSYIIAVSALVAWAWRSGRSASPALRIFGSLALILAALHQFNLALIALVCALIGNLNGLATLRQATWLRYFAVFCGLFAVWVAIALLVSSTAITSDIGPRKAVRALVDYPNFRLFWSFVLERPVLAIPLALGTLWSINGMARRNPDPVAVFLGGGFWAVLFANGILETKFEFFRYNLHLDVFHVALSTLGIIKLPELLEELGWEMRFRSTNGASSVFVVITAVIVFLGVRPDLAYLTSERGYPAPAGLFGGTVLSTHPDFQGAAEFVRDRLDDNDRIFVIDPREYWNYIGRVDYWIYSDNYQSQTYLDSGTYRDLYLGVPVITDIETLRKTLAARENGTDWFLYSTDRLQQTPWVSDEIKRFLESLEQNVVYTGRDDSTVVVRLQDPDTE